MIDCPISPEQFHQLVKQYTGTLNTSFTEFLNQHYKCISYTHNNNISTLHFNNESDRNWFLLQL